MQNTAASDNNEPWPAKGVKDKLVGLNPKAIEEISKYFEAEAVIHSPTTSPQLKINALTEANLSQLIGSTSSDFAKTTATTGAAESSHDSYDSDRSSISDSYRHAERLNDNDPHYPLIKPVISQLFAGYVTRHQNPLPVRESGQEVVSSTSVPSCETATRRRIREIAEPSKASFVCPFLKKDPIKYRDCCVETLMEFRDVKHHLVRRHAPGRYCPSCFMTGFANERSLQDHMNKRSCSPQNKSRLERQSQDQYRQLFEMSGSAIGEEEQWFVVWAIVFPESPKPASVYIDTALSVEMQLFCKYSLEYGQVILERQIMSSSHCMRPPDTQEEQVQFLDRIIVESITRMFEEWQSAQSTAGVLSRARMSQYIAEKTFESR